MRPPSFMVIAGEPSGDQHAASLVLALRRRMLAAAAEGGEAAEPDQWAFAPRFFGAGGPRMAAAGVELTLDMTAHSVVGFVEVLRQLPKFGRIFRQLIEVARRRQPDVVILVDYGGFNRRFAAAIKALARQDRVFANWRPKVVYFVSPQVWASRERRALQLARDVDLLLSIIPFEKAWYAQRTPQLRVEFVGHPMADHHPRVEPAAAPPAAAAGPWVLLLPGSRGQEVRRQLPVMRDAMSRIREATGARFWMVLPDSAMAEVARSFVDLDLRPDAEPAQAATDPYPAIPCSLGNLGRVLSRVTLALACSGTVTVECAWYGVPTVVMYRVAWPTYALARLLVRIPYIAMPNLLAGTELFPEFVQSRMTVDNVSRAAIVLLRDGRRRRELSERVQAAMATLGPPGACDRAAKLVQELLWRGD